MKKNLFTLLFSSFTFWAWSQVITTSPAFPKDTDPLTITYDATQGNAALECTTGTLYMHTGVITTQGSSAWQYIKGTWGTADATVAMTSIGNGKYTFTYPSGVRAFHAVPAGTTIYQQAFVFRDAAGNIVGRTTYGGDIFSTIYSSTALDTKIISPNPSQIGIYTVGNAFVIQGASSLTGPVSMLIDGTVVASQTAANTISYTYTATTAGNHTAAFAYVNGTARDTAFYRFVTIPATTTAAPAGTQDGITYNSASSATLQLYAPNKQNVFLIGSMNNWEANANYQLKKTPDGNRYWIQLTGLTPGQKYTFQYLVDGKIKIADPYSETILNQGDDPYIPAITYPNLTAYPANKTTGNVTLLEPGAASYSWKNIAFKRPDKRDLTVYEMYLSDFIARHDYKTLKDTLDYIQRLGINTLQLMPNQEFEGNISWGYNTAMQSTLDKYYGTKNDFKRLVDECHTRGIAVVLDIAFNHVFSQSPLAQLYWDKCAFKPTTANPWLNPDAKHPFNVGYDFNHESQATKDFLDKTLRYWMQEYKVDGFRFDLSKGFTQNYTTDVGAWGAYDASRIVLLKRMADAMRTTDPNVYIILEHYADNWEEMELANYGMMIWGKATDPYTEAAMGWLTNSNFAYNVSSKDRNWGQLGLVGFIENHDEERTMFKVLQYGNSTNPAYNVKDSVVALKRMELAGAFLFTVPGPKMIYQFQELGYNHTIYTCSNGTVSTTGGCRTDSKPMRWNYITNPNRKALYTAWRKLMYLKRNEPAFRNTDYTINAAGAMKTIKINDPTTKVIVVGNFDVYSGTATPVFYNTGKWYEYFTQDSINVTDVNMGLSLTAGEYRIYTSRRIKTNLYCPAKGGSTANNTFIYNVTVGNNQFTSGNNNGYADFTSKIWNLPKNTLTPLSITPGYIRATNNMGYGIWIDYNQDGDFSDAGEQIFSKSLASRSAILSSFTIPTTAKLGYTRMRVILQDGTYPRSYCGDITTGEVEDYTINIVAAGTSLANELMNREATTITNLTATPNPFTNETVISFDNKNNEQFSVSLTDVLGRTVQSFTNQTGSQITLTRNNLPSGWYILTLAMQNGERYTHKLVIE